MKRVAIILLALAAVAAALAAWLLRLPAGQARLEALLRAQLPESVEIGGLSGRLPFAGRAADVALRDEEGVWLEAEDVEWRIVRRSLLRRELVVRQVDIRRLFIHRAPISPAARNSGEAPDTLIWPFWIQNATVEELHVGAALSGEPFAGRLLATFKMESNAWTAVASLSTEWRGEPVFVVGSAKQTAETGLIHVRQVEAEGIRLEGSGMWRPREEFRFSGTFSNAPLVARLATLDAAGTGSVEGVVSWSGATRVDARISASGWAGYGLSNGVLEAEGVWRGGGVGWSAVIRDAHAEYAGEPIRVALPARVGSIAGGFEWYAPRITAMSIEARSAGRLTTNVWDADLEADAIDLASTPLGKWLRGGRARAIVRVAGSTSDPVWTLDTQGIDLDVRTDGAYHLHPAQASLAAIASGGVARLQAAWSGWTASPVEFDAQIPLSLGGARGEYGINPEGPIAGRLHFAVDLADVGTFTDLRGSEIQGWLTGDVTLGGIWIRPEIQGRIVLTNGNAVFAESGAALRNFVLVLEGDTSQLTIRRADGHDGAGGRISAEGAIRFEPADGFPLDAALTLHRATIWRQNGNLARLSGRVALVGTVGAPMVTGQMSVAEAEIRLRPTPPSIPRLPVEQVEVDRASAVAATSYLNRVKLDIGLRGRNIRVNGRGLDSSWRADLHAAGSMAAPQVRGVVSLERGFFLFMGRRFALERAALSLDGRWPPEPMLDLLAVSRVGDMYARFYAVGPFDAPELALESEPAYPPDEILSRLLYSRSTDALSPFQAVRLAHGLNLLRGRGRTIDVLERGQSALRLDQIELVQSDEDIGISAISVGKYIGRRVYVEGEKSLGDAADSIAVEVELTPSLILTTETSPRIREGIGLKWRKDY